MQKLSAHSTSNYNPASPSMPPVSTLYFFRYSPCSRRIPCWVFKTALATYCLTGLQQVRLELVSTRVAQFPSLFLHFSPHSKVVQKKRSHNRLPRGAASPCPLPSPLVGRASALCKVHASCLTSFTQTAATEPHVALHLNTSSRSVIQVLGVLYGMDWVRFK